MDRLSFCPLFIVPVIILVGGCFRQQDVIVVPPSPAFCIKPKSLDFGRVRETDSSIELKFDIENFSDEPLEIKDVYSSCGCTIVDKTNLRIHPKSTLSVPIQVSVTGRLGNFSSNVTLLTSRTPEKATINICGEVIRDIWYNGQPIRCTIEKSAKFTVASFEVYTYDYPDVEFAESNFHDIFTIKEIARSTHNRKTTIRFELTMYSQPESFTGSITLMPKKSHIEAIQIPIICYISDGKE